MMRANCMLCEDGEIATIDGLHLFAGEWVRCRDYPLPRENGRWYLVCSPEWGETIPILDDGSGPMEYGRDVLYVCARSARRARSLFVRAMRRVARRRGRDLGWAGSDENPFRGVTAEPFGP